MPNIHTAPPLLKVRVVPSSNDPSQFVWQVFEHNGVLLASSTQPYSDDRKALRDANAAARHIVGAHTKRLMERRRS
jgi:hypothetical protein